jgi:ferrous-iron efflux pump FieF
LPDLYIHIRRLYHPHEVAVNLAVLAALAVTRLTGSERVDPTFALAISGYMLWSNRGIARGGLEAVAYRPRNASASATL